MMKRWALALLALTVLITPALNATPTRVMTIDNGNLIAPDDYDATYYYSLAPHFKNHWYADVYGGTGKSVGWAFLDLDVAGTLVIWWNKPFEGGALYDAVIANNGGLGMNATDFGVNSVAASEAKELRVKAPDNKLALGYAYELSDALNLGFCFRLAQLNQTQDESSEDGTGGSTIFAGAKGTSAATYQGSYYSGLGLGINKYSNTQASSGMVLSPQFSYTGESILLDTKFDMVWTGIANKHTEDLRDVGGTVSGTLTQTLKDKGTMSWYVKPRLRYALDQSSSIVLRGTYGVLDLSNEHRVTGSFSGAGLSTIQKSGYDHVDFDQALTVTQYDFILGLLKTWDKGKNLVVLGAGLNGQSAKVLDRTFQQSATAVTYNDLVKKSVVDVTASNFAVPVVMGTELSLNSWCKGRAMITRNFFTGASTATKSETFNSSGTLTAKSTTNTGSDLGAGWVFASGFGLNFGQLSWDIALNTGALSSGTATQVATTEGFINPIYQSSFTYEF